MKLFYISVLLLSLVTCNLTAQDSLGITRLFQVLQEGELVAEVQIGDLMTIATEESKHSGAVSGLEPGAIFLDGTAFPYEEIRFVRQTKESNGLSTVLMTAGAASMIGAALVEEEEVIAKNALGFGGLSAFLTGALIRSWHRRKWKPGTKVKFRYEEISTETYPWISVQNDTLNISYRTDTALAAIIRWSANDLWSEQIVRAGDGLTFNYNNTKLVDGTVDSFTEGYVYINGESYALSEIYTIYQFKPASVLSYLFGTLSAFSIVGLTSIDRSDSDNGYFEEDLELFGQMSFAAASMALLLTAVGIASKSTRLNPDKFTMEYQLLYSVKSSEWNKLE